MKNEMFVVQSKNMANMKTLLYATSNVCDWFLI
jgi:hypothetical protein